MISSDREQTLVVTWKSLIAEAQRPCAVVVVLRVHELAEVSCAFNGHILFCGLHPSKTYLKREKLDHIRFWQLQALIQCWLPFKQHPYTKALVASYNLPEMHCMIQIVHSKIVPQEK